MRLFFLAPILVAQALADEPVSFTRDVAPILHRRCLQCHQADETKGRYRLDTFSQLLKPGDSGLSPLEPGQPDQSELYTLLIEPAAADRMPQKADPLPDPEIALIRRWIAEGSRYDGGSRSRPLIELVRDRFLADPPAIYPRPIPISALAFSPDGQFLAVAGYHEITLWRWNESLLLTRIAGMPERITALAWHPTRPHLAVAGGTPLQWGGILLVDPFGIDSHIVLCDLPETPLTVAYDSSGTHLASGAGDRTVRIFDAFTGKTKRVLRPHADWVQSVAFSPDGRLLVSASRDRTARIIEVASGDVTASYTRHDTPLIDAAFSANGERVWTLGRGGALHRWVPSDGTRKGEVKPGDLLHFDVVGDRIATLSTDRKLRLHTGDKYNASHTTELPGSRPASLARSADGTLLAIGFTDGTIAILDAASSQMLQHFRGIPSGFDPPATR